MSCVWDLCNYWSHAGFNDKLDKETESEWYDMTELCGLGTSSNRGINKVTHTKTT